MTALANQLTCHGCKHCWYSAPGGQLPHKPEPHSRCIGVKADIPMTLGEHQKWRGSVLPANCPEFGFLSHEVLARVTDLLPRYSYRFSSEVELHQGIALALDQVGIPYVREFVAGPCDRFDFLLATGIVIEAKIKGSLSQAMPQLQRYMQRADVSGVILATTRYWGAADIVPTLDGKPVRMVKLRGDAF